MTFNNLILTRIKTTWPFQKTFGRVLEKFLSFLKELCEPFAR